AEPTALITATATIARLRAVRTLATIGALAVALGLAYLTNDMTSPLGAWLWLIGGVCLLSAFAVREVRLPELAAGQWLATRTVWDWLGWATVAMGFGLRLIWADDI